MTPEDTALPKSLRIACRKRGLSMLQVAELLEIPLPIYKLIEAGRLYPERERLKSICDFFELEVPETEN